MQDFIGESNEPSLEPSDNISLSYLNNTDFNSTIEYENSQISPLNKFLITFVIIMYTCTCHVGHYQP